jgi:hypothetical protein
MISLRQYLVITLIPLVALGLMVIPWKLQSGEQDRLGADFEKEPAVGLEHGSEPTKVPRFHS